MHLSAFGLVDTHLPKVNMNISRTILVSFRLVLFKDGTNNPLINHLATLGKLSEVCDNTPIKMAIKCIIRV